jgi:23S rRNA pseudouridine1911/1915/1917 synthase
MIDHPTHEITPAQAGAPVAALAEQLGGPVGRLAALRGGVWLDGQRVLDPQTPVAAGTQLVLRLPPGGIYREVELTAGEIAFEDEWLIVLHKRAGCYVSATPWDVHGTLLAALGRFLTARDGVVPSLHLAHRLDRDTTGLLLFSKHPAANAPLQAAFAAGLVAKRYSCLCAGTPEWEGLDLRTGHGRGAGGRWRIYPLAEVGRELPMGGRRVRLAHTSFIVEARMAGMALVRAMLHTGRTHQIRLHMASLGYPLLGDVRYGGPANVGDRQLTGQLLHAAELRMAHPLTGAPLELSSPLPQIFAALL